MLDRFIILFVLMPNSYNKTSIETNFKKSIKFMLTSVSTSEYLICCYKVSQGIINNE